MSYLSITDEKFLGVLRGWFRSRSEVLVLIRYSRSAGARDYELISSFDNFSGRLLHLPHLACVTVFKQPQLPIRGVVDDALIEKCLGCIPDGAEYLFIETVKRSYGAYSCFHHGAGMSHEELRDDLEQSRGIAGAAGVHPAWLEDSENVISAVVPDEGGSTSRGVY